MKDTQSRKWLLTINNSKDYGFSDVVIKNIIEEWKSVRYACMSDEIGEEGTYHTHIYIHFKNAVRFSTLKNKFPVAHIDMSKGTSQQNKEYVFKEGKWKGNKKEDTNLKESHWEFGELPLERQGERNDLNDLYDMIKSGIDDYAILDDNPRYMLYLEHINKVRQILNEEKYKDTFRDLQVTYIYGKTGTGKTRSVMEQYGYRNVFRVTDYMHPFDNYRGQDVIIFEEFRSSLKIQDMLNYLDGYPLELPCRYTNKIACYTKVYMITNIPLNQQYTDIRVNYEETWNAFLRRLHKVKHYIDNNNIKEYYIQDYLQSIDYLFVQTNEKTPFDK